MLIDTRPVTATSIRAVLKVFLLEEMLRYVERNALRATSSSGRRIGAGAVYGEGLMGIENRCCAYVARVRHLNLDNLN